MLELMAMWEEICGCLYIWLGRRKGGMGFHAVQQERTFAYSSTLEANNDVIISSCNILQYLSLDRPIISCMCGLNESIPSVSQSSTPRGVIEIDQCLSIKGAEDAINKPNSLEISTSDSSMFFIAESEKEKEDWINAVGRAIVRHSSSVMESEQIDYTES